MDAMRESWSGVKFFISSTASSAITFSTMFNSAISSSPQNGHGRLSDFTNLRAGIPRSPLDIRNQMPEAELRSRRHRAGRQPGIIRADQITHRRFGSLDCDTEELRALLQPASLKHWTETAL